MILTINKTYVMIYRYGVPLLGNHPNFQEKL